MFAGIVEASVPLQSLERAGAGARLVLPEPPLAGWEVALGDSVAVSGVCLTVAAREAGAMAFDLSAETLERTWFGGLAPGGGPGHEPGRPGRRVNLERALRLCDRVGGHLVSGHVDGGGRVVEIREAQGGGREMAFEVDPGLERYLIEKGSVTLDGVSLTVVRPAGRRFDVALIPLTLGVTSLGEAQVGQRVNVEVDLVGKWIERLLGERNG